MESKASNQPNKPALPPQWIDGLLEWFCPDELLEEVQGDLHERYLLRVQKAGEQRARNLYFREVLAYMRPSIIKRKTTYFTKPLYTDMLQHNLLLIYRNFRRFKGTFFINLIGLSTGLACTLLIYLWVNDELSFDKFHQNDSQLFQAMLNHQNAGSIETSVATPAPLAEALAAEMPSVKYAVSTVWAPQIAVSVGDKHIKGDMQFVSKDFFNLFSYELLQGDKEKVLSDKSSIVLSRELAMKLFNTTENIIGKPVIFYHQLQLLVSGIFDGTPANSSEQFDFLLSFEVYKDMTGVGSTDWGTTGPRTFVSLTDVTHSSLVENY